MITIAKISAVRASGVRRLFEGGVYSSKYGKPLSFNMKGYCRVLAVGTLCCTFKGK